MNRTRTNERKGWIAGAIFVVALLLIPAILIIKAQDEAMVKVSDAPWAAPHQLAHPTHLGEIDPEPDDLHGKAGYLDCRPSTEQSSVLSPQSSATPCSANTQAERAAED